MGLGVGARTTPGAPSAWSVQWRATRLPVGGDPRSPRQRLVRVLQSLLEPAADPARPPASQSQPQEGRSRKVALDARVSSPRQEQDHPIASPGEAREADAVEHGYEIVPEGRFLDEGDRGARLDRPALDALRDALQPPPFDAVLIPHPDRLARPYADQAVWWEACQRAGVAGVFWEQPPLDDPAARLLVPIQGAVAE